MVNNIPEIAQTRKVSDYALVLILILLGTLSFGLGRLSVTEKNTFPVTFCEEHTLQATQSAEKNNASVISSQQLSSGQYVGSKNGSVYHLPWCSGAKRIAEENMVWFNTKEEAESAGYRPAANCKGL